jgi:serine protease Do
MNGIDLNRFQFEYDLTWMSYFQNSDGRTYARYGGREDAGPETQLNKKSLLRVMQKVLELHQNKIAKSFNRYEPDSKQALMPEQIPAMQRMLANRKNKCIHCHDVKSAQLKELHAAGNLKKEMIYTYPSPLNLGIQLDANDQQKIKKVVPDSAAAAAGISAGDVLKRIEEQNVLTFADVTRVLELAPAKGELKLEFERAGKSLEAEIQLTDRWRISQDPSWRESTHAVGPNSGFWGVRLNSDRRKTLKIPPAGLALRVTSIWGNWARQAGIKQGDVIVSIDDRTSDMSIKQLQTHLQLNRNWGDKVSLSVNRNGKRVDTSMTLPEQPNN